MRLITFNKEKKTGRPLVFQYMKKEHSTTNGAWGSRTTPSGSKGCIRKEDHNLLSNYKDFENQLRNCNKLDTKLIYTRIMKMNNFIKLSGRDMSCLKP